MAISPPSDIVLDVARAVEPSYLEAARTELARRAGAGPANGMAAAFSLAEGQSGQTRASGSPEKADTHKKFEAMVLQTFIQNMLPKDAESVYGKGMAGDMWKSMMAGRIADVMADRGGIGIADRLLADRYVDGETVKPIGPVSRGPETSERDRETMLSTALVQQLQIRTTRSMTDGGTIAAPPAEL